MSEKLEKARLYEIEEAKNIPQEEKPAFHVSAPVGWINDPNGFSVFKGKVHLFYQYHPYSRDWGPMHWGHSVTEDMIRWEQLPTALAPDQEYDREGCFSGSAIEADGKQALIYTGVTTEKLPDGKEEVRQNQCLAWGDGKDYVKAEKNPVVTGDMLPEKCSRVDFRDPKVWEDNGTYHMLVGCRSEEIPGQVVLFSSKDLKEWKFETILAENSTGEIGVMWECPDFFPLGDKHVLICSPQHMRAKGYEFHNGHNSLYFTGDYDSEKHTFEKDAPVSLDYGLDFYAPQTTLLPDGRRVMIAWMKSWDSCVIKEKQRWQGMMTLPRELEYRDGKIWQKPVREIENYRKNRCCYENVKVGESLSLEGVRGRMIDLTVELQNADGIMDGSRNSGNPNQEALDVYNEFRIELARNEEYTTVFTYDRKRQILKIVVEEYVAAAEPVGSKAIADLSGKDEEEMRHQVDAAMAQTFRPEFLNRIDDIVVFHPLGMAQIEKIVDIQLADVRARLAKERMTLAITPAAKQMLAVGGLDPVFGARPLKRLVQREVVDAIAAAIIDGTVREGDQVTVDADKDGGFTVVCDNTPAATYEVPDAE